MSLRPSPFTFVVAITGLMIFVTNLWLTTDARAQTMDATTLSLLTNGDSSPREPAATALAPSADTPVSSPHYQHKKTVKRVSRKPAQVLQVPPPEPKPDDPHAATVVIPPRKIEPYGFGAQVRDVVLGGTDEEIGTYRAALPAQDTRLNHFEFQAAPLFMYNDSKSANWARTYQTSAEGIDLNGAYWFSPTFALNGQYTSSFGGSVTRAPGVPTTDAVQDRWLSLGFRFRRFYGPFERPTHFTLGFDYNQYQHVSDLHDGDVRNQFTTSGPRVTFEALIPTGDRVAWKVGVEIVPFGFENESSTTNPQILSGAHSQTMRAGLSFGPEYLFDRGSRVFLKASGQILHTTYDSMTSYNSPVTGLPASAENITNTFVMLELGYIWGN